jgi:hypothetical protein
MAVSYIKISISGVANTDSGELASVRLLSVESSRGMATTYELPYILHALGRKDMRMPIVENNKFTYTFPFKLS